MGKKFRGIQPNGEIVEIGEIHLKYQTNSKSNRPVLKMLQLKNGDSFFFCYNPKSNNWTLNLELGFISPDSSLISAYQNMKVSCNTTLQEFQVLLFKYHYMQV